MSILPGLPSFFKTRKPKPFQYIPRYYDEQKESRKERNALLLKEKTQADYYAEPAMRRRIRQLWGEKYAEKKRNLNITSSYTNLRLLVILGLLLFFAYRFLLK